MTDRLSKFEIDDYLLFCPKRGSFSEFPLPLRVITECRLCREEGADEGMSSVPRPSFAPCMPVDRGGHARLPYRRCAGPNVRKISFQFSVFSFQLLELQQLKTEN
jgi:hypothetical protein